MLNRMYQLCVFVVGMFLVSPPTVYADGCHVVKRSYQAQNYNQYQAPTVSYAHQHQNYYQPTTIYPLAVQQFYQVAPDIAQAQVNKITAKEAAKEALEEYERKQAYTRQQTAPQTPPTYPSVNGVGNQAAPLEQTQPNTDPLAGVEIKGLVSNSAPNHNQHSNSIQGLFNARCTKCHSEGSKWDFTNVATLSQEIRERIVSSTHREEGVQAMPPKDKLTALENQMIRKWVYANPTLVSR